MSCNKCGKCCETIILSYSIEEVKDRIGKIKDAQFIVDNWTPVSKEDAIQINSKFDNEFIKNSNIYFYKCLKYDNENSNCSNYENRPDVCKNYPFYPLPNPNSREFDGVVKLHPKFFFYSENCGFKKFIATEEEWNKEYQIIKDSLI